MENRCEACFLHPTFCVCGILPRVETSCRWTVIRHAREAYKTSNTARLAARSLVFGELLSYGGPSDPLDFDFLHEEGTWLLYPGESTGLPEGAPPKRIVVLDGSWTQTRRMTQRLHALRKLPRFALAGPSESRARLRRPTVETGMSTLEAMAHGVAALDGDATAEPLFALHDEHVRRIHVLCGKSPPLNEAEALALGGTRSNKVRLARGEVVPERFRPKPALPPESDRG